MDYRSGLFLGGMMAIGAAVAASGSACSSSSTAAPAPAATNDSGIVATEVCAATGNYDACFQCCNPPTEYAVAQQAFYQCSCAGACGTVCADSVCNDDGGVDESPACSTCLEGKSNAAACGPAASNVCNADANCSRFSQCISAACNNLPASDAGH